MAKKKSNKVSHSLKQRRLDKDIESLDELEGAPEPEDFERVIQGHSTEALELRRNRREIRYRLSRIQTMVNGGPDAEDKDGLKEIFEGLEHFGGWRFYKITWDVAMDDPYRIVHKDRSEQEEWEAVVRAKFPVLDPLNPGRVVYPDVKVKEKVKKYHGRT